MLLNDVINTSERSLLARWVDLQVTAPGFRGDRISRGELQETSRTFFSALQTALASGQTDIQSASWRGVRDALDSISKFRAEQGFSPSETATFVFSLKEAVFEAINSAAADTTARARLTLEASQLFDRLGLYTTEVYQRSRESVIVHQQQEMLELSTPVVTLWNGVLALPVIGTLDSARTQVVMENLLQRIVETGASIAIIDITGVPTVDTLTAQHLLKTIAAARLMGADCIISGIRPQIAQTIVHLGVELGTVVTKATLADAFGVALHRLGLTVQKQTGRQPPAPEASEAGDGRSEA